MGGGNPPELRRFVQHHKFAVWRVGQVCTLAIGLKKFQKSGTEDLVGIGTGYPRLLLVFMVSIVSTVSTSK